MVGRLERASHRWQAPCDLRIATAGNVNCQDPKPLSRTMGTQLPRAKPPRSAPSGGMPGQSSARSTLGTFQAASTRRRNNAPFIWKGSAVIRHFPPVQPSFLRQCARVATGSRSPNVAGEPSGNQPQDQPRRHAYVEDHAPQPLQRITHGRAPCRLQRVHDHANDFDQHAKHRGQQHQANGP